MGTIVEGKARPTPLDVLRQQAAERPASIVLERDGRTTTYAAFCEAVDGKAATYAMFDIGSRSCVGIVADEPEAFLTDLYAVLALGAVAVPLSPRTTSWELEDAIGRAGLSHLLTPTAWEITSGSGHAVEDRRIGMLPASPCAVAGPGVALFTSGTTGSVKLAFRTAEAIVAESAVVALTLGLDPARDRIGCQLPLYHAYASGLCGFTAVLAGVPVAYLGQGTGATQLRQIAGRGINILPTVPSLLRILVQAGRQGDAQHPVMALSAGAPLDARTPALAVERLGFRVGQVYGTTETGILSIQLPAEDPQRALRAGPPLEGVRVRTESGRAAGEPAPLEVATPWLMSGYLSADGLDTSACVDGWFRTGDLGEVRDGEVVLTGRTSTAINVGGVKVAPEEIEAVIMEHPDVGAVLVHGIDDELTHQRVVATVAPATVDLAGLRRHCEQRLSGAKLPQRYAAVSSLPSTPLGKVMRPRP